MTYDPNLTPKGFVRVQASSQYPPPRLPISFAMTVSSEVRR